MGNNRDSYTLKHEIKNPKICVIGAGISGICAGVKLKTKLGISDLTIFDENYDIGGTWLLHTYPKCSSDVPSHLYSFSFEQNPAWSSAYTSQPEYLEYLKNVARKHDLYPNVKFNHQVRRLVWQEDDRKWKVTVYNKKSECIEEHFFDFVIAGPGGFRVPNIPEVYKTFEGPMMHSAKWDSSIDLEGKVVAVIGSGTSAVQIVPGIADKVKTLYSFQRRPAWVMPRPQVQFANGLKTAFAKVPGLQRTLRSTLFWTLEASQPAFRKDNSINKIATWIATSHLKRQIPNNPELREKLTPDYKFACKRIAPSNEYYPALTLPHVKVIRDKVTEVKGRSIVTEDGEKYEVDVLILATGYNTQDFFSPTVVIGRDSIDILDTWRKTGPYHYLGIMTYNAPNLFILLGPNTGIPYSTNVFPIECQVNWAMKVIAKSIRKKVNVVSVTKSAQENYMEELLTKLKGTVFGAYDCGAWFANEKGVITALYFGSLVSYWRKTRKVNMNHLQFH